MMKQCRFVFATLTILAATLVFVVCSGPAYSADNDSPITIGMVVPLTGHYAPLGKGDVRAAKQVVKRINANGGVNGRQINLIVKDDQTSVNKSVALFNQLAGNEDVSIVLSSSNVSASVAVGQMAKRAEVPILALGPVSAFADGSNEWAFTVPATPEIYAQEMVDYLASTGVEKLAILYDGKDVYGVTGNRATKAAAKAAGIEIVLDEEFDSSATNFSALIHHVKDSGSNNLLVWGSGPAPVIITKQVAAVGGINLYMTGSEATTLYTKPSGEAAEGVVIVCAGGVAASAMPEGPWKSMIDAFAASYQENYGVYPPQFAFDGGSGIQLAVAAIEKAGSIDREAIRDALETLDVLTLNGHYTYGDSDHSGLTTKDLGVVVVQDGQLVPTDFIKKQYSQTLPR